MKLEGLIKPWYRYLRNIFKYKSSQIRASFFLMPSRVPKTVFIVGCGRSGTIILGKIIGLHSRIYYLFEPWHLWAAVDKKLDLNNLHASSESKAIVDETFFTKKSQRRFEKLFFPKVKKGCVLIEKTPHNILRIGYLEKIIPNALYIHIVRNGFSVIDSIDKLSRDNSYRIATRGGYNQWWGENGCKWEAFRRDSECFNYFSHELHLLKTCRQRAAYEWVVSLKEMEKHKAFLGDRLLEVKYEDLVKGPHEVLMKILGYMSINDNEGWLRSASSLIRVNKGGKKRFETLKLPCCLCEEFNAFQEKYGFSQRAAVLDE